MNFFRYPSDLHPNPLPEGEGTGLFQQPVRKSTETFSTAFFNAARYRSRFSIKTTSPLFTDS